MSRPVNATANLAVQTARDALSAGRYERGSEVRDALADILHYCDLEGIDLETLCFYRAPDRKTALATYWIER